MVRRMAAIAFGLALVATAARAQSNPSIELSRADVERLGAYQARIAQAVAPLPRRSSLAEVLGPVLRLAAERSATGSAADENRMAILAVAFYVNGKSLTMLTPAAAAFATAPRRRVSLSGRTDLAQHFTISAALSAAAGAPVANLIGLYKELDDARRGSGFSFVDLTADRAGTTFGRLATGSAGSARRLQGLAGDTLSERQIMPGVDGLPEHLSARDFERQYRGDRAPAYDEMLGEIDRRIDALYRWDE